MSSARLGRLAAPQMIGREALYCPSTREKVPGQTFEITEASHHPAICPREGVCPSSHVLLARVKGHLQQLRRTEQSGFRPHRSTVDRITTLNMILRTRREYRRPSWVAYVDFRSAFDSIDRQSLWLLLRSKGIPDKILELLEDLYSNTLSCISRRRTFSVVQGVCRSPPGLCSSP